MDWKQFVCRGGDGTEYRCYLAYLQNAIALRHSDTVDARYLVNGKRITVALPHAALAEHARRAGAPLSDEEVGSLAASCLKDSLENGGDVTDIAVPAERVLELANKATGA